mgnify:CR=1 FL=1
MRVTTCVFDAYGTLFDVSAAARAAAAEPACAAIAESWPALAATWRDAQLRYTWLRAAAGVHADFWSVTRDALGHALETHALADPALRDRLLQLYWELAPFPEVAGTLRALREAGQRTAILSNASPEMLRAAVASAGIGDDLDLLLSAEQVGVFKPDHRVYGLVEAAFGVARREVLFASSNGWDAWAGTSFGFRTVWVNRAGAPAERLTTPPEHVRRDLSELPALVAAL